MAKEYIEREALTEEIKKLFCADCNNYRGVMCRCCMIDDTLMHIDDTPAADVAPVVHGGWEWYEKWVPSTTEHPAECQAFGWRCSNCKRDAQDMGFGYWDDPTEKPLMIYCPVCGAKMDGGKK